MHEIRDQHRRLWAQAYAVQIPFFPLIAAVLEKRQPGRVLVDDVDNPSQLYVEHSFGFSQIFGDAVPAFERALEDHFFKNKNRPKIRLYGTHVPVFLLRDEISGFVSERQRYILPRNHLIRLVQHRNIRTMPVDENNMAHVEEVFPGIIGRFWNGPGEFINSSLAVVSLAGAGIACICYAAAVAGGKAEVDIATHETFRRQGFAGAALEGFVKRCLNAGIEPVWDCFTNNLASVRTCRSAGFVPENDPYSLYTLPADINWQQASR